MRNPTVEETKTLQEKIIEFEDRQVELNFLRAQIELEEQKLRRMCGVPRVVTLDSVNHLVWVQRRNEQDGSVSEIQVIEEAPQPEQEEDMKVEKLEKEESYPDKIELE